MINETIFQLLFAVVALSWIFLWLKGAQNSGLSKKSFWHNELEPWWVFWPVRALVLLSIITAVLYLVSGDNLAIYQHNFPDVFRYCGLLLAIAGLWLFRAVFNALAGQFSTSLVIQEGHLLVSTGPYRYIRHPMYWAYIFMWSALWLISAHAWIGMTGVAAIVYVMVFRTPKEEKMLEEQFGEQWLVYKKSTGLYFPRFRRSKL